MSHSIDPSAITSLHNQLIIQWKAGDLIFSQKAFYQLVEENHAFNYQLWHAEDKARRDDMGFEFVYQAKREIDSFNQQRNNRMEAMDGWLFAALKPAAPDESPVNSESPGMIIDRLSILSLKSYHMALQAKRLDATPEHRHNCAAKLAIIHLQLEQLEKCLGELIDDVVSTKRTFRIYQQFKMYNDPTLNPELYSQVQ